MSYVDIYADTDQTTKATVEFYKNDDAVPYVSQEINFFPNLDYIASVQDVSQANPAVVNSAQHGLTTGDTVYLYGSNSFDLTITGITQANPAVVTVIDIGDLVNGQEITINDVEGMTEVNFDGSNLYTVAGISGNTFQLSGIDSSAFGAYTQYGQVVWGMPNINSGNGYVVTVIDANNFSLDGIDTSLYGKYQGGAKLYLKEFYQSKAWVRAYGGGIGYLHWIKVIIQATNSPCRILGHKPAFKPRGKRTIN